MLRMYDYHHLLSNFTMSIEEYTRNTQERELYENTEYILISDNVGATGDPGVTCVCSEVSTCILKWNTWAKYMNIAKLILKIAEICKDLEKFMGATTNKDKNYKFDKTVFAEQTDVMHVFDLCMCVDIFFHTTSNKITSTRALEIKDILRKNIIEVTSSTLQHVPRNF